MERQHALDVLRASKADLERRYGITRLVLFGSLARGVEPTDGDVDVLVAFDGPATSDRFFGVQFLLEDRLGRPVDLVTERGLRPELRPYVERDAIAV